MKVLHVNDYRSAGGCEVVMDTTVSLLRARGIEVEVFTCEDVPGHRRTPVGYVDSRVCRRELAGRLTRSRPDVVHLHNFYHVLSPGILGVLREYRRDHRLAVVMTAHDYHLVCPNAGMFYVRRGGLRCADASRLGSLSYLLSRKWDHRGPLFSLLKVIQHIWNYRFHRRRQVIDCVLCPSRFMQRILASHGCPTMFVPHPAPKVSRTKPKPAGDLRLVFAGRVEPEKGLCEFLQSFPPSFPGRLTIVGDGSLLQRCRDTCRHRNIERIVEFTGRLPRDEVISIIERSHVLVLPSLGAENHPMSLLEALAAGTNILVSDLGGMREIVECAGVGFSFAPNHRSGLVAALDRVVECFRNGTLNRFDVSRFLSDRDEQVHTDRVIRAYGLEQSGSEEFAGRLVVSSA